MDERRFFSGRTIEQAIMAAARHHQLEPERVEYRLRDKKQGFLRVGRRVVIEVDPSTPEKTAETAEALEPASLAATRNTAAGDEGQSPPEEASSVGQDETGPKDELEAVDFSVKELVDFAGLDLQWSIRRGEEAAEVDLEGYDRELLIDEEGAVLQAMEHLIPRLVRGWTGKGIPCKVDSEGFQASREQKLMAQAEVLADEVLKDQEARRLEPMNPADRRIVHMTLADRAGVETESEGEGLFKRVKVYPATEAP